MTNRMPRAAVAALIVVVTGSTVAQAGRPVPGAADCPMFPTDSIWNTDISTLPVHPRSGAWLSSTSAASRNLHPDFGPSFGEQPVPYGIPYAVVDSGHAKETVTFEFADESDPGPYPFGADTPIEGGSEADGDRHALMVDKDTCTLYELYTARYAPEASTAGSGAIWDLRSNALRPEGWTSADAAGLPILPGLLRLDEVQAGAITHAVRFTVARTDRSFVWPARHHAGAAADPNLPPMGARFRLKSSFALGSFRPDTQVVLRALQQYGLMLADNGSDWFVSGTSEPGWDVDLLDEIKQIPAAQFEAVDTSSLMVSHDSGAVASGPADPVDRLSGSDRIATAVAVSAASFGDGQAAAAVLSRADAFPDALAGTPLAVAQRGPLLLTGNGALDPRVRVELRRAAPAGSTVYLLGGTSALSEAVAADVQAAGFRAVRLAGSNRFATAVAVADQGLGNPPNALLVTGTDFPDALAAGTAAPRAQGAVLLTAGPSMAAETAAYLAAHPPTARYAVGGAAAAADPSATAIVGANRYDTARLVAERFFTAPEAVGVASGMAFADALAGGAHAGARGTPLLLSAPTSLPAETRTYLEARKSGLARATVYGGTAALSDTVSRAVGSAIT